MWHATPRPLVIADALRTTLSRSAGTAICTREGRHMCMCNVSPACVQCTAAQGNPSMWCRVQLFISWCTAPPGFSPPTPEECSWHTRFRQVFVRVQILSLAHRVHRLARTRTRRRPIPTLRCRMLFTEVRAPFQVLATSDLTLSTQPPLDADTPKSRFCFRLSALWMLIRQLPRQHPTHGHES